MRILVESLRRLYQAETLTLIEITERLNKGSINQEGFDYIVS